MNHLEKVLQKQSIVVYPHVMDTTASSLLSNKSLFSRDHSMMLYPPYMDFIHEMLVPQFKEQLQTSFFQYTKLRISNNNNHTDASFFHRDVIYYPHGSNQQSPMIYTCLYYVDPGVIEIIPGSDRYTSREPTKSVFETRQRYEIPASSLVIFRSTLLHRGCFQKERMNQPRRLIQLFDCFLNEQDMQTYLSHMLMVRKPVSIPTTNQPSRWAQWIGYFSTISSPVVFQTILYASFQVALSGYNPVHTRLWLDQHDYKHVYFLSSDAEQPSLDWTVCSQQKEDQWLPSNCYLYSPTCKVTLLPFSKWNGLKHVQYTVPYQRYLWQSMEIFVLRLLYSIVIVFVVWYFLFSFR